MYHDFEKWQQACAERGATLFTGTSKIKPGPQYFAIAMKDGQQVGEWVVTHGLLKP